MRLTRDWFPKFTSSSCGSCESWTIKKCRVLKNWWTVVLGKTPESPLDCKEIKPVNPKGNQSWIFIGRTDTEAETPTLWPPDVKNWLFGKDPDVEKDWRQEEKGVTVDEMVGWYRWLNGHDWASSGRWWGRGKPGVLQSMGSQIVRHEWVTKLNWTCGSIKKKTIKICTKHLNRHLFKEDVQIVYRPMKKCSTSIIIRTMQIKTMMRYLITSVKMAIIKKSTNKCWRGYRKKGTLLHCWWE